VFAAAAFVVTLVLALAGAPAALRAQESAGAGAPTAPEAPSVVSPPAPDPRNARGERIRPWHEQPWSIMARSAILPGWGQWKNGRPWKALGATVLELGAGYATYDANRDAEDALARRSAAEAALDDEAAAQASADYDEAYNRRTTWAWVLGTTLVLSMLDAYVDAHLLQFDADFGPDPEPLSDLDAAMGRARGGSPGMRAGIRMTFTGP